MKKRQTARLDMFKAVLAYCTKSESVIKANPVLTELYHTLRQQIAKIDEVKQSAQRVITGIQLDKQYSRKLLTEDILLLTNILFAHAMRTEDHILLKEVQTSVTKINRMGHDAFHDFCVIMLDTARKNMDALKAYEFSEERLKEIAEKISQFALVSSDPRNAISTRSAQKIKLEELMRETGDLLKNQLDKLVRSHKLKNPEFYHTYKSNRKVLTSAGTVTQLKGTVTSAISKKKLQGIEVAIWNGEAAPLGTAFTDANGGYRITGLPVGQFTVKAKDESGKEQVVPNVEVHLGKVNRLDLMW
jgi:Carboxypeptidase regulatory-like domain